MCVHFERSSSCSSPSSYTSYGRSGEDVHQPSRSVTHAAAHGLGMMNSMECWQQPNLPLATSAPATEHGDTQRFAYVLRCWFSPSATGSQRVPSTSAHATWHMCIMVGPHIVYRRSRRPHDQNCNRITKHKALGLRCTRSPESFGFAVCTHAHCRVSENRTQPNNENNGSRNKAVAVWLEFGLKPHWSLDNQSMLQPSLHQPYTVPFSPFCRLDRGS